MIRMRIYLAGPMSGLPDYNYPAFHAAAAKLRADGHEIVNPAENFDGDQTLPWDRYLRESIRQVTTCEGVVCLPGWESSKGACLEVYVAWGLGLAILSASDAGLISGGA